MTQQYLFGLRPADVKKPVAKTGGPAPSIAKTGGAAPSISVFPKPKASAPAAVTTVAAKAMPKHAEAIAAQKAAETKTNPPVSQPKTPPIPPPAHLLACIRKPPVQPEDLMETDALIQARKERCTKFLKRISHSYTAPVPTTEVALRTIVERTPGIIKIKKLAITDKPPEPESKPELEKKKPEQVQKKLEQSEVDNDDQEMSIIRRNIENAELKKQNSWLREKLARMTSNQQKQNKWSEHSKQRKNSTVKKWKQDKKHDTASSSSKKPSRWRNRGDECRQLRATIVKAIRKHIQQTHLVNTIW